MLRYFEDALGVPRFVARAAVRAALWHLVFVGSVTVIKSGTNALFLARADPTTLPLLYVAVAAVVALVTSVLARLLARSTPARVLDVGIIAAAVTVVGTTAAAALGVPGAPAAAYVVGEAAATSGSVLFWARIADAFQTRDQKKVVGLVGAGGMLGAALGGLLMRLIAETTGVAAPMIVSAVLWVATLPLLGLLRSRGGSVGASEGDLWPALRYLSGRGYPVLVATLVVLLAATGAATDFVFRTASAEARSEAEMAGLFGLLNTGVGVVVVAFQLSLTSRLLGRLGVFAYVAIVPMLLVATSAASMVVSGTFGILLVMKGIEMAGAYSLNQTAVSLLYNPMPPDLRSQVRTLIDGAIKKSGAAAAGLVLGALAMFAPLLVGPWLVAVMAGGTLLMVPLLRARYLDALDDKLGQKKRFKPGAIDPSDKVTRTALQHALLSDDAERVLSALQALGERYVLTPEESARLVEHDDERVRTAAIKHVPAGSDDALTARLVAIAGGAGPRRPRAEAVRALARVHGGAAAPVIAPYLDDDEPGVVAAAVEVALRLPELEARARARLEEVLTDLPQRHLAWRREVARLLGALDDTRYDGPLAGLIGDADGTVRALAIDAAGRERHAAHVPLLVEHLADRRVRARTIAALARYGDDAVEALKAVLDDRSRPLQERMPIPRVLEAIGTDLAVHALLFSNPKDDAYLQQRIAHALVGIVRRAPGVAVDRKRVDEAIGRRLVAYDAYDDALRDLAADPSPGLGLLRRAVRDRCLQNLRIALDLLGVHRGLDRMQTVYAGLASGQEAQRHDALELLDAALSGDPLREDFLSLLERKTVQRELNAAHDRCRALCRSKDPLLRALARSSVGVLGLAAPAEGYAKVGPGALELEGADMPDALVERLFLLEHVELFEGLPTDDLSAIAAITNELTLPAGAFLYREGESGTQMYVIVEGEVELSRMGRPVMKLRTGQSAGEVTFLDRGPRPLTGRISERGSARLLVIERDAFTDLLTDRPGLMHAFLAVLASRIRALVERDVFDPSRRRVPTSV
ncbi:MAG: cyclic nucleotide-binding domain-containing protein [Deltaproteobacteria bacterium]|nr:cyclic nucleotide-binding domain-containing protein [Deltaproteobacteria bacterium]